MGNVKSGQRQVIFIYSKDADCIKILFMLLKLIYEDRGGRMNQ